MPPPVRLLALVLLAVCGCAAGRPRAEELPAALQDPARNPRFPSSAYVTAIGYGRDRESAEADAKKRVSEAVQSQIDSQCRVETSAGPQGEREASECRTRVVSRFENASLIQVDSSLTREASGEWRAFASLERARAEAVLADEQRPQITGLMALWQRGAAAKGTDALQADCEADRRKLAVKRGLAVRRSLLGRTADEALVAAAEQASMQRRAERTGRAEVTLLADDALGRAAAQGMQARLLDAQLKVREGDSACTVGVKVRLKGEQACRATDFGPLCTAALTASASFCGESRDGFSLRSAPANAVNASDADLAARAAARKLDVDRFAQEAVQRVKGALGVVCEGD